MFFLRIILKRTSTEAHVYMPRHQGAKVKHFDVSNVIYHKFSYGAVSYTHNGENVNVMLEFVISTSCALLGMYSKRYLQFCSREAIILRLSVLQL